MMRFNRYRNGWLSISNWRVIALLCWPIAVSGQPQSGAHQNRPSPPVPLPPIASTTNSNVDRPQQDNDGLPVMRVASSRSSNRWVPTTDGSRVAVGEGIEYDGIRVHMALTWHLVAVDVKTDETIWSHSVSAFWNVVQIEKRKSPEEPSEQTLVALRCDRNEETKKFVEYYDLKTGKKLPGKTEQEPDGARLKVIKSFHGDRCDIHQATIKLISQDSDWEQFRVKMFGDRTGDELPPKRLFDDTREVVLVICSGDSYNCRGIKVGAAYENPDRILVRLHYSTFQSFGDTPVVQPFGVFVLPKNKEKKYVVQRNAQNLIGGPAMWRVLKELEIDEP